MNKPRTFLLIGFLFAFIVSMNAEPDPWEQRFSPQEFVKRQEAFITREAGLTPQEAATFFPILHQKEREERALRHQRDEIMRKSKEKNLSDKECKEVLDKMEAIETQLTKLYNSYRQKYRKILSPRKVLRVLDACDRFLPEILKQANHRQDRQWPQGQNAPQRRNEQQQKK